METLEEEIVNILSYWFGLDYWKKGDKDPDNCTAYWDGSSRLFLFPNFSSICKTKQDLWRLKWFAKEDLTAKVDSYLRENFGNLVERALRNELDHWTQTCHGKNPSFWNISKIYY